MTNNEELLGLLRQYRLNELAEALEGNIRETEWIKQKQSRISIINSIHQSFSEQFPNQEFGYVDNKINGRLYHCFNNNFTVVGDSADSYEYKPSNSRYNTSYALSGLYNNSERLDIDLSALSELIRVNSLGETKTSDYVIEIAKPKQKSIFAIFDPEFLKHILDFTESSSIFVNTNAVQDKGSFLFLQGPAVSYDSYNTRFGIIMPKFVRRREIPHQTFVFSE